MGRSNVEKYKSDGSLQGNLLEWVDARFPALPLTLGEAVEAFRADGVLTEALGPKLSELLVDYHADEWARFCGYVTDWERTMYWDDLP